MNKMYITRHDTKRKIIIGLLGIIGVILGICITYYVTGINYDELNNSTDLKTGWMVEWDNYAYKNVPIEDFVLDDKMNASDTIVIHNKLPKNWDYETPVLVITTHNQAVSVSINGKKIYEYGYDRYSDNKMVGSGIHYIPLYNYNKGKSLKIVYTLTENTSMSTFDPVYISDYSSFHSALLTKSRMTLTLSSFLMVFGFILMLLGFLSLFFAPVLSRVVTVGILSLCVGVWTLCYYRIAQIFAIPLYLCTVIENFVLYIAPLPIMCYCKQYMKQCKFSLMEKIYWGILVTYSAYVVLSIILQFTNIRHFPSGVKIVQVYIFIISVYIIALLIQNVKRGNSIIKVLLIGAIIMIVFVSADLLNYSMLRSNGKLLFNINGVAAIGTTIFILCMLITFALEISAKLKRNIEQEMLYVMAYTDELTQIHNRRYCDEQMKALSDQSKTFGVFSFDLNSLKKINDTLGHSYGDRLIKGFAEILKETFDNDCTIGRMGGDEFIAILVGIDVEKSNNYINKLKRNIANANLKETTFKYSASYGYATSIEVMENDPLMRVSKVCALADERMYECKRKDKDRENSK